MRSKKWHTNMTKYPKVMWSHTWSYHRSLEFHATKKNLKDQWNNSFWHKANGSFEFWCSPKLLSENSIVKFLGLCIFFGLTTLHSDKRVCILCRTLSFWQARKIKISSTPHALVRITMAEIKLLVTDSKTFISVFVTSYKLFRAFHN